MEHMLLCNVMEITLLCGHHNRITLQHEVMEQKS